MARARQAGERELAAAVHALRRPTRGAWAVNLLVRAEPDAVGELLALGEQLRRAQAGLRRAEMRDLAARRQELVAGLVRSAMAHAGEAGQPLSDESAAEVEQSLLAALADPDVAASVRQGRLTHAESYVGFGPPAVAPVAPVEQAPPVETAETAEPVESVESARLDQSAAETQAAAEASGQAEVVEAAEAELELLRTEAARLEGEVGALRERRAELAQELDETSRRLRTAQQRARAATGAVRAAQRRQARLAARHAQRSGEPE